MTIELKKNCKYALIIPTSMGVRLTPLNGQPMHTETGYLRHSGDGHVEFVLAQPTGQVEIGEGDLTAADDGFDIELRARVLSTSTAKDVTASRRVYRLRGDRLETRFEMAAVGQPMTQHLASKLVRSG